MTPVRWLIGAVVLGPLAVDGFGASQTMMAAKNAGFIHLGMGLVLCLVSSWWLRAVLASVWLSFAVNGMHAALFLGLLGVVCWALLYEASSRLTEDEWRAVRLAITVAATAQVAWMILQAGGMDPLFTSIDDSHQLRPDRAVPVVGWFSNPSDTALFLGLSIPAAMAVNPLLGVLLGLNVLVLRSTAGFACLAMACLWLASRHGWRLLVASSAVVAALGTAQVLWIDSTLMGFRGLTWRAAVEIFKARPWAGWGVNSLESSVNIMVSPLGAAPSRINFLQNDWLQWATEAGVIGGLVVLAWVGWQVAPAVWRHWQSELSLAAVMLAVTAAFSIPFRVGPVALLGALYLGRLGKATVEVRPA